ncbi:MAG: MucR family transcriptional regulator [Alphaproteobacteria bacterium]|jgi:predicted transcriptional regulator|nr:MucR family transcriptional regulator [Alphaproteobacteria bacterium]MDP6590323.1 MucR family transcriptional regulator [Alphaproteobacteria bacterium]MDP6816403.1 MucR family transcriptional regulator [Alphaproteobacteria bacterium]|tara:strand:+ start:670 stop:1086 length:417 start_codon:yes stop_codon:yes gene_type:complete
MAKLNNSMILIELTVNIVSSHVSNNSVTPDSLPDFIKNVHASLSAATAKKHDFSDNPPQPAVPIRKSVSDDYLICLEDGKKLKMLRRHLKRAYGMTPEQYRARWGLPSDYPMVAPSYAAKRSELAKKMGLGTKPGQRR